MSQPNAFLILGDHPFLNYIFLGGKTRLFNTAGNYNPNLTLAGFKNYLGADEVRNW